MPLSVHHFFFAGVPGPATISETAEEIRIAELLSKFCRTNSMEDCNEVLLPILVSSLK